MLLWKDLLTNQISSFDLSLLTVQTELSSAWTSFIPSFPSSNVHVLPSIEHAIKVVRDLEKQDESAEIDVIVTGSLHLVGGVIEVAGLSNVAL
jgi:folylpolyglutamate synthase